MIHFANLVSINYSLHPRRCKLQKHGGISTIPFGLWQEVFVIFTSFCQQWTIVFVLSILVDGWSQILELAYSLLNNNGRQLQYIARLAEQDQL